MRNLVPLFLIFWIASCATTPTTELTALPAGEWQGDPTHTSVVFRIGHGNGLSMYTARFDQTEASLSFDPSKPEAARLSAQISAASLHTGLADFDQKLIRDVFRGEQHPLITFESGTITPTGPSHGDVSGQLTMAGVTKPVTLKVTFNGGAFDPLRGRDVVGFSARTTIDRTEWGLNNWVNFGVGRDVEIWIESEFVKQG